MDIVFPAIDMAVIAPATTVFVWATVLLLVDTFAIPADRKRVTGYLALAGLVVTALVTFGLHVSLAPGEARVSFSNMVVLDTFAVLLTWIFLLVAAVTIAISLDYLPYHQIEIGEYYPLLLFATGGLLLLAQSTNLIMTFLAVELLSITLYILTALFYPRLASQEAGMKYLLLGAFAAGFFVYGIALIYGGAGSTDLNEIGLYLSTTVVASELEQGAILVLIGLGLLLVAFGFKIALVPFHMWTPDVYEGAPTPVAAYMSVGTKGAALAALLRILITALPTLQPAWIGVMGGLAVATMFIGNIAAIAQTNVKRMLAYSSIGHAGYIVLAIMAASTMGADSFLFYLFAYALTNLGAFSVLIALEQRGECDWSIDNFSGLWQRHPQLAIAMALFMLSLAGVPPTAGFFAKFQVFTAAWDAGLGWLAVAGVVSSAIAAFFYLRIIVRMFMHEPVREVQPILSRGVVVSIAIAAVAVLLFGLLPTPIVNVMHDSLVASR